MRAFPDFGNVQDNVTAFHLAMDEIAQSHSAWGRAVLVRLREHIRTTHDIKSVQWLLPHVEAALQRFSCDEQSGRVDVVAHEPRGEGEHPHTYAGATAQLASHRGDLRVWRHSA